MSVTPPLRLHPILKPRLWGGTRLADDWGKVLPTQEPYGESWELTWRPDDMSRVTGGPYDGRPLDAVAGDAYPAFVGRRVAASAQFPLLIKLLDCSQRLSVQVHPTSAYAAAHRQAEVKMEAWYVLDAPADARLIFGLTRGVTRRAFADAVREGCLQETLVERPVRPGDVLLVKPGTVHALLEGLLVYEIQQSSDTTYRVYDWDRVDASGRARELHVDQALECIAFDAAGDDSPIRPLRLSPERELLVATPSFALERLRVDGAWAATLDGTRCEALTVIAGRGMCLSMSGTLGRGDTLFVPANVGSYRLEGEMVVLRGYVPDWEADVWAAARAAGHGDDEIRAATGGMGPHAV